MDGDAGYESEYQVVSARQIIDPPTKVKPVKKPVVQMMVLYNDTVGMAGFVAQVQIVDSSLAHFTRVNLNDFAPLGLTTVGNLPRATVRIGAVDANNRLAGQDTRVVVATLTIELLQAGDTQILLSLDKLDDDVTGADQVPLTTLVGATLSVDGGP